MSPSEKLTYEESYLGQLRKLVGSRPLISPGARAIIRDEHAAFYSFDALITVSEACPLGGSKREA
jgi:hypothetical protein